MNNFVPERLNVINGSLLVSRDRMILSSLLIKLEFINVIAFNKDGECYK